MGASWSGCTAWTSASEFPTSFCTTVLDFFLREEAVLFTPAMFQLKGKKLTVKLKASLRTKWYGINKGEREWGIFIEDSISFIKRSRWKVRNGGS